MIFKQIVLVGTLGSVKSTVWRVYKLMLECRGLMRYLIARFTASFNQYKYSISTTKVLIFCHTRSC